MNALQPQPPALEPSYLHFKATVTHMVDGDTADLHFPESFHMQMDARVRLLGINAPEVRGLTAVAGKAATVYLSGLLMGAESLIVQTYKPREEDMYGRWLAEIWASKAGVWSNVNQAMLTAGHAVPYWPK